MLTTLTVSQLNQKIRLLLEANFSNVIVEGEISNFSKPQSGHWYFSLKDQDAQVRCAMFKFKNNAVDLIPKDGEQVQIHAKVSIYAQRGDYQLIVHKMTAIGAGDLQLAYQKLLKKLSVEGLFQEDYKKASPTVPTQIGVITSPTGAAVKDILSVLERRFPGIPITLYPSTVQGKEAALDLVKAVNNAVKHNIADVIIIARGGGSLEDLWPFNEEPVVRSLFACHIPIVSGVGHEVDFTLTDLVADIRAPTPSAAAELIVPSQKVFFDKIADLRKRLILNTYSKLQNSAQTLDWLQKRLRHPGQAITLKLQRVHDIKERLRLAIIHILKTKGSQFTAVSRALNAVSPLAVLDRGYSITCIQGTNKPVATTNDINIGEHLSVQLSKGQLECVVESVKS